MRNYQYLIPREQYVWILPWRQTVPRPKNNTDLRSPHDTTVPARSVTRRHTNKSPRRRPQQITKKKKAPKNHHEARRGKNA
ncbi:hypothetical protein E2C01_099057 [Portunus trituberculatus]|uniref:Uncharacterized protein n=1 Tax=Portunus trituberculatus TaxID=210409 RepID=A0A5B7KEF3_PORTR|nr:hypothetical protein [Portunus trituberculatus]